MMMMTTNCLPSPVSSGIDGGLSSGDGGLSSGGVRRTSRKHPRRNVPSNRRTDAQTDIHTHMQSAIHAD